MKKLFIVILFLFVLQTSPIKAKSCIFCKSEIINHDSIYETEHFNVLLDLEPRVNGHLLLIPKRHIMKAHELHKEEWEELSIIIPKVVTVFSKFLNTEDYIILEKNGYAAFQDVSHVHFHLFPVHTEKWSEIFDIIPLRLNQEVFEKQIHLFREYFLD